MSPMEYYPTLYIQRQQTLSALITRVYFLYCLWARYFVIAAADVLTLDTYVDW